MAETKAKTGTTGTKKKKPASTAKKKPASTSIRLSAEEKKLVQNFRKCNLIEKKLITAAVEKAAAGIDLGQMLGNLK